MAKIQNVNPGMAKAIADGFSSARFVGFKVVNRNGKEVKVPIKANGSDGVSAADLAHTIPASDVCLLNGSTPPEFQYFGVDMVTGVTTDDAGNYLVCLDGDFKRADEALPIMRAVWAKAAQAGLLREMSHSGKGFHVFIKATPESVTGIKAAYALEFSGDEKTQELEVFGLPDRCKKSVMLTGDKMSGIINDEPIDLAEFLADVISAEVVREVKNVINIDSARPVKNSQGRYEDLQSALGALDADDRELWVSVGLALYGEQGGYALWDGWSSRSSLYDAGDQEYRWSSFSNKQSINAESVFHWAQQAGWINPARAVAIDVADDFDAEGEVSVWDHWVFVEYSNSFMNIRSGLEIGIQAFNLKMSVHPCKVAVGGKVKEVKASEYAVRYKGCRTVYSPIYAPHAGMFFEYLEEWRVNSYSGRSVPSINPNWRDSDAWRSVEAHFLQLFPTKAEGRMIIQWMAHNVQNPGDKILWAPVVCGVQGDGKSTIRNILGSAMGAPHVKDISADAVFSAFNGYAEGACVGALEEIRIKGHNRFEVMNKLKPLITNPVIDVTRKGRDGIQVPNTTNYIAFSNHPDAIALDDDDRRWGVFFTRFNSREQMLVECPDEYWEVLHNAYRDNPEIIRGWLLDVDLAGFPVMKCPEMGDAKRRMIGESRSDDTKGVLEAVEDMDEIFSAEELVRQCRLLGINTNVTAAGRVLREAGYQKSKRMRVKGDLMRLWYSRELFHACPDGTTIEAWLKVKAEEVYLENPFVP